MRTATWLLIAAAAPALALAQPAGQELSAPPLPEASPSPSPPPPPPPLAAPGDPPGINTMSLDAAPGYGAGKKVRLELDDGQTLSCELLSEMPDRVTIRIGSGAPFEISRASIRRIEPADGRPSSAYWFRDANVSRHFYAPTAFMLRAGEGYFSQKELVFSSFGYGVTDNFSLLVGSVVPAWFAPGGHHLVAGFKIGADFGDIWHVAGGAQGLALPFISSGPMFAGVAFLTLTVGTPDVNLTASVGQIASAGSFSSSSSSTTIVAAGASFRAAPNVALVTENWFFPWLSPPFSVSTEPFFMLNSVGVRLMSDHLAADLGLVRFQGSFFPIPWVDFTYSFGY